MLVLVGQGCMLNQKCRQTVKKAEEGYTFVASEFVLSFSDAFRSLESLIEHGLLERVCELLPALEALALDEVYRSLSHL